MSGLTKVSDGLDEVVSMLRRAIEAVFHAGVLVGLACIIFLLVAGTYGILHNGDDFEFGEGGGGGRGGDIIVMLP
ncbi:MAG: hypothetical protein ACRDO2_03770 [Nocardioidaceae bacterium]